jgi:hypothetical protein
VGPMICEGSPSITIYLEKENQLVTRDLTWNYYDQKNEILVLYGNPYEN